MLLRLISFVMLVAIAGVSLFPETLGVFPAGLVDWVSEHQILSLLAASAVIFLIARGVDR